ncbi:MAG: pitrilysin family protein [Planctomycetota bacterium]|nr:pitrilysin family protein [Planctomycetota bacterium]
MPEDIHIHEFDNGLVLLAEPIEWFESAAFSLLVPAGACHDPADQLGLSNFLAEMVQRGAGRRNSREFVTDLELLGADASTSVTNAHVHFGGAMPAESLLEVLSIYADVVRRPQLPSDQLEDGRAVCLQEIREIEDDLGQRAIQEVKRLQYGEPYGRNASGSAESIHTVQLADLLHHFEDFYRPGGAILSVVGKIDWPRVTEHVETLFTDWQPKAAAPLLEVPSADRYRHLTHDSSWTYIAISNPAVPYSDKRYPESRAAVGALGDGLRSRLFTELWTKRELCDWASYATVHTLRDRGCVTCYAAAESNRAQEALAVLLGEIHRLAHGIETNELEAVKAGLKFSSVRQLESSPGRSSSLAADWYHLGRVCGRHDFRDAVDDLTCDRVNAYLATNPPRDFRVVTLGRQPLETNLGIP